MTRYLYILSLLFASLQGYTQPCTNISLDQDIYESNCKKLFSPSLLERVDIVSVENFPKQKTCTTQTNNCINFLTHTVGSLEDFLPFNGPFSRFSLSGSQNGLLLKSHTGNLSGAKFGEFVDLKDYIFNYGYFDVDRLYSTAPSITPESQSYACSSVTQNLLITRAGLFRDFLISSRQAQLFNFKIAKSINNNINNNFNSCSDTEFTPTEGCGCDLKRRKTYNQFSNVTFFRVWFKVKPKKVGTDKFLKLYANFKLFGEVKEKTELPYQYSDDIFSIRIMEIEKTDEVNFPYVNGTTGFTENGCNSNTYLTIPIKETPVVGGIPKKYFKPRYGIGQPIREVVDQSIRTPNYSDDGFNSLGFPFQSKLYSYEYDLEYPTIMTDGTLSNEKLYSVIVGVADCGPNGLKDISGLLVQLSDAPIIESIDPCGNEGYLGYTPPCCNTAFSPTPGKKYVVQGWCKLTNESGTAPLQKVKFSLNFGSLTKSDELQSELGKFEDLPFKSLNEWVRFEIPFTMPSDATVFDFEMSLPGVEEGYKAYLDDLRIIPIDSEVKSYVYDSESGKLKSELDSQNYAVHFTYDETGRLVRTSKETSKGVKTINIKIEDE